MGVKERRCCAAPNIKHETCRCRDLPLKELNPPLTGQYTHGAIRPRLDKTGLASFPTAQAD